MRNINAPRKQWMKRILTRVSRCGSVRMKQKIWMLLLLFSICILIIGQLQSAIRSIIQGEVLDLAWLSGLVMTGLTTFLTVSEFFEKFIGERPELKQDQRRDYENEEKKNAE